jgi:hypothetical protein
MNTQFIPAYKDPFIWCVFLVMGLSCRLAWLMTQVGG